MQLSLQIIPLKPGDLVVRGIVYNLCVNDDIAATIGSSPSSPSSHSASCEQLTGNTAQLRAVFAEGVQGRVNFGCRGSRLNSTKAERLSVSYAPDYRLNWRVIGLMPKLLVRPETHTCV